MGELLNWNQPGWKHGRIGLWIRWMGIRWSESQAQTNPQREQGTSVPEVMLLCAKPWIVSVYVAFLVVNASQKSCCWSNSINCIWLCWSSYSLMRPLLARRFSLAATTRDDFQTAWLTTCYLWTLGVNLSTNLPIHQVTNLPSCICSKSAIFRWDMETWVPRFEQIKAPWNMG